MDCKKVMGERVLVCGARFALWDLDFLIVKINFIDTSGLVVLTCRLLIFPCIEINFITPGKNRGWMAEGKALLSSRFIY